MRCQQAGASSVPHSPCIATGAVASLPCCCRRQALLGKVLGIMWFSANSLSVLGRLIRREHSDPIVEELNPGDALEPEGRGTGGSLQPWQWWPMLGICHRATSMLYAWACHIPG